jgi:hypothetical protein
MISERLQLKLRQYHGKRLLPMVRNHLARALKKQEEDITFLSLEAMGQYLAQTRSASLKARRDHSVLRCIWPVDQVERVKRLIDDLAARMPDQPMLLFGALREYCGLAKTGLGEILQNAFDLVELDQEDILAWNEDGTLGLLFYHSTEWGDAGSRQVFELELLGKEWREALSGSDMKEYLPVSAAPRENTVPDDAS